MQVVVITSKPSPIHHSRPSTSNAILGKRSMGKSNTTVVDDVGLHTRKCIRSHKAHGLSPLSKFSPDSSTPSPSEPEKGVILHWIIHLVIKGNMRSNPNPFIENHPTPASMRPPKRHFPPTSITLTSSRGLRKHSCLGPEVVLSHELFLRSPCSNP